MRRTAITPRTVQEAAAAIREFLARHGYTEDREKALFTSVCGISQLDAREVRRAMKAQRETTR
jgi:site-specific recombinase XerC